MGSADKYQSEVFTADVIAAALALSPSSHLRMFYFGSQPQKLMMENGEGERDAVVRCLPSLEADTDSAVSGKLGRSRPRSAQKGSH